MEFKTSREIVTIDGIHTKYVLNGAEEVCSLPLQKRREVARALEFHFTELIKKLKITKLKKHLQFQTAIRNGYGKYFFSSAWMAIKTAMVLEDYLSDPYKYTNRDRKIMDSYLSGKTPFGGLLILRVGVLQPLGHPTVQDLEDYVPGLPIDLEDYK